MKVLVLTDIHGSSKYLNLAIDKFNNLKCESLDVVLPKRIVNKPDFGETMSKLQALVKTEESELLYERLCDELNEFERSSSILLKHLKILSEKLVFLHKNNWDGMTPKTRTIAGIDLQDDITAQEMTDALVLTDTTDDVDYIMGIEPQEE